MENNVIVHKDIAKQKKLYVANVIDIWYGACIIIGSFIFYKILKVPISPLLMVLPIILGLGMILSFDGQKLTPLLFRLATGNNAKPEINYPFYEPVEYNCVYESDDYSVGLKAVEYTIKESQIYILPCEVDVYKMVIDDFKMKEKHGILQDELYVEDLLIADGSNIKKKQVNFIVPNLENFPNVNFQVEGKYISPKKFDDKYNEIYNQQQEDEVQ